MIRAAIPPEGSTRFVSAGDNAGPVTISPDGRHLAYAATGANEPRVLWLRTLDNSTARELTGTEEATFPFWSADSKSLGFFADGKLKKVPLQGGPTMTLCDARDTHGGTWGPDGTIVISVELGSVNINAGSAHGISAGDRFRVYTSDSNVLVGKINVTEVWADHISKAEILEGKDSIRPDDIILPER